MMSKKQWFVLLCLFIIYLLLGASFFYAIETLEETKRRDLEKSERKEIEGLLVKHYVPSANTSQEEIFQKLSDYCGKPMHSGMADTLEPLRWDFYHSLFFVITVVSTIGYGNLAPTTMLGRIFMIFYGLIGIPINGIVMVTLGEFFGTKFTKLYNHWKTDKMHDITARLGLIGQIVLYLVPGFTFFIFIPSVIIMILEGWEYDVAVYYAFVTLTTIGFGDYVAGVNDNGFGETIFISYKIFLLVWIIIGLGYVVMVLGFISRGMRSKRMQAIEHMLSENIKRTPFKFRALRSLIHEILLLKVKPVYKKKSICVPTYHGLRSQSCPDLSLYTNFDSPTMTRKRALSETIHHFKDMPRVQSDTDLHLIDKELTFESLREKQQTKLLLKVSNVLGNYESLHAAESCKGIDLFNDDEIMQSETYPSEWTLASTKSQMFERPRACSEVGKLPFYERNDVTWYGQTAAIKQQEMREKMKHGRARSRTLPVQHEPLMKIPQTSFLSRLRKTFISREKKERDIERQMTPAKTKKRNRALSECENYMQQTKGGRPSVFSLQEHSDFKEIAQLLLALTNEPPKRKYGLASLTPPKQPSPLRRRRASIRPALPSRRTSMATPTISIQAPRRFSLRPTDNDRSPLPGTSTNKIRRFSLRPVTNISTTPSPVQRQRLKTNKDAIKEGELMN